MCVDYKDFITLTDVARHFGVSRKTVYNWLSDDIAPRHQMIAGMHFFYRSALADFQPPKRGRKHGNAGKNQS